MASYDYSGCYTFSTVTYPSPDSVYGLSAVKASGLSVAACAAKCNNPAVMAMLSDASEGATQPYLCICYSYFDSKIFDNKVAEFGCHSTCGDGNACGAPYPCSTFSESGVVKPCTGEASVYMRKGDAPAPPPTSSTTTTPVQPTSITTPPTPNPTTPGSGPNSGVADTTGAPSVNSVITSVQTSESTTIVDGKPVVVTISSTVTIPNPAAVAAPPQKSSSLAIIIGGAAAGVAVIALVIIGAVLWSRRNSSRTTSPKTVPGQFIQPAAPRPDPPAQHFEAPVRIDMTPGTKGRGGLFDDARPRESVLPPSYDSIGEVSATMTRHAAQAEKFEKKDYNVKDFGSGPTNGTRRAESL